MELSLSRSQFLTFYLLIVKPFIRYVVRAMHYHCWCTFLVRDVPFPLNVTAYLHECNVEKTPTKILHSTRARNSRQIHDNLRFFNPKFHCQRITQVYTVRVNNKSILIFFGNHSRPLCTCKTRQNFLLSTWKAPGKVDVSSRRVCRLHNLSYNDTLK